MIVGNVEFSVKKYRYRSCGKKNEALIEISDQEGHVFNLKVSNMLDSDVLLNLLQKELSQG